MGNMELDIYILWHTDETKALNKLGIDVPVEDFTKKTVTFYNIDVISPYKWDDDHMFCKITAGGEEWIAPFTYEEVRDMIAETKRLNK